MEKIITYLIGKNKIDFNIKSVPLLSELLYDSQIETSSIVSKEICGKFALIVYRPDYNRKYFVNLFIFKVCFIKENKSKLFFETDEPLKINYKDNQIHSQKYATVYSISENSPDSIIIETELFNIDIKKIKKIELKDIKKSNNNYLRLINSTGLDIGRWQNEYVKINNLYNEEK